MSKKLKPISFIIIIFLVIVIVVMGTVRLSTNYLNSHQSNNQSVKIACNQKIRVIHQVLIQNNTAVPVHTDAKLCETLVIINMDDQIKLMAFGEHQDHQTYDGVTEKALTKGQDITVTLNQTGTYKFHDHIGNQAQGTFTVTK